MVCRFLGMVMKKIHCISVSDSDGKFHPVSFMISSNETQQDFTVFYQGLINESEKLDINYEPELIMQDACPASRNAILDFFPNVKFLMCYFHVKKNVRDHKNLLRDKIKTNFLN